MGWDPRTQQVPARRSRAMMAGIGIAVAAVAAAAATVAVVLLNGHHNTPSGTGSPSHSQTSSSSTAPSTSPSVTPSVTGSSPSQTPSTAGVAGSQATSVSNLLATGSGSSVKLTSAVDNIGSCTDIPGSIDTINAVRDQRQTEYSQAQSLAVDALQNGAALKSDLTRALSFSLKADDDYLAWAQQQSQNCQPGSPPANASAAGNQALKYKTLFVGLWNPVAISYGLPATTVANI